MPDDKKIFIDEDWKAQVQREKEMVAASAAPPVPPAAEATEESAEAEPGHESLFLHLMTDIATQALFSLGLIAPQGSEQIQVDLNQAKYLVETLLMLQEKTAGNLTPEEATELAQAIAELQRVFMVRAQQIQEAAMQQAGIDPKNIRVE